MVVLNNSACRTGQFSSRLAAFSSADQPPRVEDKSAVLIDPSTSEVLGIRVRSHAASLESGCCCKASVRTLLWGPVGSYTRFLLGDCSLLASVRWPRPLPRVFGHQSGLSLSGTPCIVRPQKKPGPQKMPGVEVFKRALHDAHDLWGKRCGYCTGLVLITNVCRDEVVPS